MSLPHSQLLMTALVDGEASPEERCEFDALAQREPSLRGEFEQAKVLVALLDAIPQVEPPPDLGAAIVAKVTLSLHNGAAPAQLPRGPHVNGLHAGLDAGLVKFAKSLWFQQERFMSEVKKGFLSTTKSRVFAGGAVAVVALAAVSFQTSFPTTGADTAGTIAPAERYRSGQQTDANVQTTGTTGTTSSIAPAADKSAGNSADRAANASVADRAANGAAADRAANGSAADRAANGSAADRAANASVADRAANGAAADRAANPAAADRSTNRAANAAAADRSANRAANASVADRAANASAADRAVNAAAADRATNRAANGSAADRAANGSAADRAANAAAVDRAANAAAADRATNRAANKSQN